MIQKNWQELIKPNKLNIESGDDQRRVATIVAEPLERGFGVTLLKAVPANAVIFGTYEYVSRRLSTVDTSLS